MIFKYGKEELDYLRNKDKKLGAVIERTGMIQRDVIPDLFAALVNSIVGQQISPKAADTVWNRIIQNVGCITPHKIMSIPIEEIRKCGLSARKAGYIKSIAKQIVDGNFDLSVLPLLPDDEIIKRLSSLPGIGVWSAEMLLIFSLQRPDVVSFGDSAIRRGMMCVYGLETLTKEMFVTYRKKYFPYGSVASFYLWAAAHENR